MNSLRIGLLALGLMFVALPYGEGFVRSNPSGFPVEWDLNCLRLRLSSQGSEDMSFSVVEAAISDAMSSWNELNCSGLELIYDGSTNEATAGFSPEGGNENLIVFRDAFGSWAYQPDILALTTLTFCSGEGGQCKFRGQILDADIEFNGQEAPFSAAESSVPGHHDFVNTLTHELGHFIGLDHSLDMASTMYASAPLEETEKRTLEEDDVEGFCSIYSSCQVSESCTTCRETLDDEENPVDQPEEESLAGCGCFAGRRDANALLLSCYFLLLLVGCRYAFR